MMSIKNKFVLSTRCIAVIAAVACLSTTAECVELDYGGYIREHLSLNLRDAPELKAVGGSGLYSPFVPLGGTIDNVDGGGQLSMARTTLQLRGTLDFEPFTVVAIGRMVREGHTKYERRLQNTAKANPLRVIDGIVPGGGLAGMSFLSTAMPGGPIPGALGSVVMNGSIFGFGGKPFLNDYDEEELREFFVKFAVGSRLNFKLGKQQVVWGETDFFRAMDIIHGYDMRWRGFLELENEELRKPLVLGNVEIAVPELKGNLQLIYRPGWDAGEDIGNSLAFEGGRWASQPVRGFDILALAPYNYHHKVGDVNDANYGFRWSGEFKQIAYSLNYYRGLMNDPVVLRNSRIGGEGGLGAFEGGFMQPAEIVFPKIETYGATFNTYVSAVDAVLRGEFAFNPNLPYNTGTNTYVDLGAFGLGYDDRTVGLDPVPGPVIGGFGPDNPVLLGAPTGMLSLALPGLGKIKGKDTLKIMLGFDKELDLTRVLGTVRPSLLSIQVFDTWIPNHKGKDDIVELFGYGAKRREHTTYLTSALTLNYRYDRLNPSLAVAVDTGNFDSFIIPAVDLRFGDNWRIRAEADLFFPKHSKVDNVGGEVEKNTRLFGTLARHDQFAIRVTYQF